MEASVCLVPLKDKKIFNAALPSKMFEYMACSKPIIVSVRGDAEKIIKESKAGISIAPEHPEKLAEAILTYYNDVKRCKLDGKNGLRFVTDNLSKEMLISNIINKLKNE